MSLDNWGYPAAAFFAVGSGLMLGAVLLIGGVVVHWLWENR